MAKNTTLNYNDKSYEYPVTVGTENEPGIDIGKLRGQTGLVTLDPGFVNTASCTSAITFLDGEKGILRYRGYPIDQLAAKSKRSRRRLCAIGTGCVERTAQGRGVCAGGLDRSTHLHILRA